MAWGKKLLSQSGGSWRLLNRMNSFLAKTFHFEIKWVSVLIPRLLEIVPTVKHSRANNKERVNATQHLPRIQGNSS